MEFPILYICGKHSFPTWETWENEVRWETAGKTVGKQLDVEALLSEGWTPRVRHVKGKDYITLRKGSQERSLGPHSEELWRRVSVKAGTRPPKTPVEISKPPPAVGVQAEELNRVKEQVQILLEKVDRFEAWSRLTEWKVENCRHIYEWFGHVICVAWRWDRKPTALMERLPRVQFARLKADWEKHRWYASPHPDLCGQCTKFMEAKPYGEHVAEKIEVIEGSADYAADCVNDSIINPCYSCSECESEDLKVEVICGKCGSKTLEPIKWEGED